MKTSSKILASLFALAAIKEQQDDPLNIFKNLFKALLTVIVLGIIIIIVNATETKMFDGSLQSLLITIGVAGFACVWLVWPLFGNFTYFFISIATFLVIFSIGLTTNTSTPAPIPSSIPFAQHYVDNYGKDPNTQWTLTLVQNSGGYDSYDEYPFAGTKEQADQKLEEIASKYHPREIRAKIKSIKRPQ